MFITIFGIISFTIIAKKYLKIYSNKNFEIIG